MSRAKMVVLAAIALGASAIGTSSALAATGDTVACKTASAPCPASSQYASGTVFRVGLKSGTKAVLATNIDTVACGVSNATLQNTAQAGTPLPGQIDSLSFSNCTDPSGNSCTFTANNLPYGESALAGSAAGNGTLTVNSVSIKMVCGSVWNCTLSAPSGGIKAAFTGGSPADVKFTNAPITNTGGLECPSTAAFSAEYLTNGTNQPVWLERSP